ncbi:sugar transferase [Roseivivax isoporae]|uniref:Exopolysaccharide biosynthesis protein n=1 Tax=Roseivivax isoporae LMG 25204 TaxID=1449351 RepID=X7F6N9_9RHOB|nr:sugar transferase [Roseivivax isoporae]ETX28547.1 exopolysaccharide biosynthesis protein [Roseivivax isoporae LMG 25204]
MTDARIDCDVQLADRRVRRPLSGRLYDRSTKRVIDILLCLVILPVILPLIALLYVLARCDGGPGFFGHRRIGRNGETFRCWKIRTMVPDAEDRLLELLRTDPAARQMWEAEHKLHDDPRITAIGGLLRRTSLDELPQIWNVLRGEMSLVGPRPITETELERYGHRQSVYLALRPGVTGLWQVSGRNDLSYQERVALDTRYFVNLSLRRDLAILARTTGAVLGRTGK